MSFQFKKFKIEHHPEVFKFGTDAALLATFVSIESDKNILEIGSGSGVITLMMAQRNSLANYVGIDISEDAIKLANENLKNYPLEAKIAFEHTPLQEFKAVNLFDHVVSNPPFFENSTKSPKAVKNNTRHTDNLPLKTLLDKSKSLINQNGKITLIYPVRYLDQIKLECESLDLHLEKIIFARSKADKPIKRVIVSIAKTAQITIEKTVLIEGAHKGYSELVYNKFQPFYLYL